MSRDWARPILRRARESPDDDTTLLIILALYPLCNHASKQAQRRVCFSLGDNLPETCDRHGCRFREDGSPLPHCGELASRASWIVASAGIPGLSA